jgi:hypothetical protein
MELRQDAAVPKATCMWFGDYLNIEAVFWRAEMAFEPGLILGCIMQYYLSGHPDRRIIESCHVKPRSIIRINLAGHVP